MVLNIDIDIFFLTQNIDHLCIYDLMVCLFFCTLKFLIVV